MMSHDDMLRLMGKICEKENLNLFEESDTKRAMALVFEQELENVGKICKEDNKMKEYTTWDMIKEITEDPEKKFEPIQLKDKGKDDVVEMHDGYLIWGWSMEPVELSYKVLNYTWVEVKEPVSFMDAIKAFHEGQCIYCIYDNTKLYYERRAGEGSKIKDHFGHPPTSGEILKGEWYIEDGED